MIHVKATINGESDIPPITKIFQYDSDSENIFFSSIELVKQRLSKNLRINLNETILVYCAYIISELRDEKSIESIKENTRKILFQDKVMIGVPESIRKISFEVTLDNKSTVTITLNEPIPTSDYILLPNTRKQV
ncbi:MAG: urease subunit gamma [Nitrosopumilales archaeon]|nr:urease subunit gamma [Nitrosopumilales archaeon]